MQFHDIKYTQAKHYVEEQYAKHEDWEIIRSQEYLGPNLNGLPDNIKFDLMEKFLGLESGEYTLELWNDLISYMIKRNEEKKTIKLAADVSSDAQIPKDAYSTWVMYKNRLIDKKWSTESIENLEQSSFEILKHLDMDTKNKRPVRGLVVGNVQSGKTANMAGLIAMAADNGFNYFVVLTGVIEKLRQQTAKRLYSDLNSSEGSGNLNWKQIANPSLSSHQAEHDISQLNLDSQSRDRYFTVLLKNSKRLESFIAWLYSDVKKAEQLKILIIDDEADQASINTNNVLEEEDPTAINRLLKNLVHDDKVAGMNYIAYTATPYANVLNESGPGTLFPHNFVVLLNTPKEYIGPKQIFGLEEPESVPLIDIVREIPAHEQKIVEEIQKGEGAHTIPQSFKDSIQWFLLSVAALRALHYRDPISMLIHTSMQVDAHEQIKNLVADYLQYLKRNQSKVLKEMKILYENESIDFTRNHFLDGMDGYSNPELVPDYPEWKEVKKQLERLFRHKGEEYLSHIPIGSEGQPDYHKGIHLVVDNSVAKEADQIVRLVYPSQQQTTAPAFIVIGGNTLSRGLTLEGLVCTFFIRESKQADTLMQMGRWFGYRRGYEVFPRIWLTNDLLDKFSFLAQMNEELREEIEDFSNSGMDLNDYAIRVKNSPNYQWLRVTSDQKSQSAETVDFNFAGYNRQTVYFEDNIIDLKHNLKITESFLNSLNQPEVRGSNLIWRGVQTEDVVTYLQQYKVCQLDKRMSSLSALINWVEKNSGQELNNWSVILSSKGEVRKYDGNSESWNIHGYNPESVTRTKLISRSTDQISNIGTLRNPKDLLIDIDAELSPEEWRETKPSEVQRIRRKYNYGDIPQLIIYRINKDSVPEKKGVQRAPLEFSEDIIGINIMIPGESRGGVSKTIAIKLNKDGDIEDIEDVEEEE